MNMILKGREKISVLLFFLLLFHYFLSFIALLLSFQHYCCYKRHFAMLSTFPPVSCTLMSTLRNTTTTNKSFWWCPNLQTNITTVIWASLVMHSSEYTATSIIDQLIRIWIFVLINSLCWVACWMSSKFMQILTWCTLYLFVCVIQVRLIWGSIVFLIQFFFNSLSFSLLQRKNILSVKLLSAFPD